MEEWKSGQIDACGEDGRYVIWYGVVYRREALDSCSRYGGIQSTYSSAIPRTRADLSGTTRQDRMRGLWQVSQGHLYATCVHCGAIGDITAFGVDSANGAVAQCVVCRQCRVHCYTLLEGFSYSDRDAVLEEKKRFHRLEREEVELMVNRAMAVDARRIP